MKDYIIDYDCLFAGRVKCFDESNNLVGLVKRLDLLTFEAEQFIDTELSNIKDGEEIPTRMIKIARIEISSPQ
jgi:hypothetical protein